MHEWIARLTAWYVQSLDAGGYPLVILLMAIESSIIPVPSELVIPFAAYQAHVRGHMSLSGVVLAGTFGSWMGATAMYWGSRLAGRPLVIRHGQCLLFLPRLIAGAEDRCARLGLPGALAARLLATVRHLAGVLIITPEKVGKAERWSARYGSFGVFASRLLPVIRHLIGIPSGIVRLDYARYSLHTVLGSFLWCAVLAWVGVSAGNDSRLMAGDMRAVTLWIAGAVAALGVLYYFLVHRQMREHGGSAPRP